jgi:hypothetical protein
MLLSDSSLYGHRKRLLPALYREYYATSIRFSHKDEKIPAKLLVEIHKAPGE